MNLNHPETSPQPWSVEKLSSMKPVPVAKKAGDHWSIWNHVEWTVLLLLNNSKVWMTCHKDGSYKQCIEWNKLNSESERLTIVMHGNSRHKSSPSGESGWRLTWSLEDWNPKPLLGRVQVLCLCWAYSCLTLCDAMGCSPPGSSVHGILQARILEWIAMPSSRRSSWPRDETLLSCASCIGRQILYH